MPTPDDDNSAFSSQNDGLAWLRAQSGDSIEIPDWTDLDIAREMALLWSGIAELGGDETRIATAKRWSEWWSGVAQKLIVDANTDNSLLPRAEFIGRIESLRQRLEMYSGKAFRTAPADAIDAPAVSCEPHPALTSVPLTAPVVIAKSWEEDEQFQSLPDESPDEWLVRIWAEPEEYDLDPTEMRHLELVEETSHIVSANSTSGSSRAAEFSANRPWLVISVVVMAVVAIIGTSLVSGNRLLRDADATSGESHRATMMLENAGISPRAAENILISASGNTEPHQKEVWLLARDLTSMLKKEKSSVANVVSPFDIPELGMITADKMNVLIRYELKGDPSTAHERVSAIVKKVDTVSKVYPTLRVHQLGDATAKHATLRTNEEVSALSEKLTPPITMLVLLLAVGALAAAGLPVALAAVSVATASAAAATISLIQPQSALSSAVITLVGMAVGTDYAFFYLRRVREERAWGRTSRDSLRVAAATSGRAVVVSAVTVMIAMAGMYLSGNADFRSIATGTILVVGVTMIGSITLLPAVISLMGDNIERGKLPFLKSKDDSRKMKLDIWATVVRGILHRPLLSVVASVAFLLLLALPTLHISTRQPGFADINPSDSREVIAFKELQAKFPGGSTPAIIAIKDKDVTSKQTKNVIAKLQERAVSSGAMREPIVVKVSKDHKTASVIGPLVGTSGSAKARRSLSVLREKVLPSTVKSHVTDVAVTGVTAEDRDFNELVKQRMPLVFGFVLGLTFIVMLCTFRSIVVPIKAILLNLLSVGAAYGALVLVFQNGIGASLIGADTNGAVVTWLPLFMFVVLFGLSMDYHVFILSRVRELWGSGIEADRAVVLGIGGTARTVTSAALVMFGVFAVFIAMPTLDMKQLGVGLSVSILIDAFVIRTVLLPASMHLLGERNWYLPRWLEWLPDMGGHANSWSGSNTQSLNNVPLAYALDMGRLARVSDEDYEQRSSDNPEEYDLPPVSGEQIPTIDDSDIDLAA